MARSRRRSSRPINPNADAQRSGLRTIGLILTVVGAIFMIVGIGSFFSSMNSAMTSTPTFGELPAGPDKFWCAFVGMPLLGIGIGMLKYGYMGKAARYVAGEIAPVATDTMKYAANETRDSVRDLASAVSEGLRKEPKTDDGPAMVACPQCNHMNDHDARFCDMCGTAMPGPKTCGQCNKVNDADARFCSGCGSTLS